jgi:hypothetical protein
MPGFPMGMWAQAEVLLAQSRFADAAAFVMPASEAMRSMDYTLALRALALGRAGDQDEARAMQELLERQCSEGRASWASVALAHLGLGETDLALGCIERIPDQRPAGSLARPTWGSRRCTTRCGRRRDSKRCWRGWGWSGSPQGIRTCTTGTEWSVVV